MRYISITVFNTHYLLTNNLSFDFFKRHLLLFLFVFFLSLSSAKCQLEAFPTRLEIYYPYKYLLENKSDLYKENINGKVRQIREICFAIENRFGEKVKTKTLNNVLRMFDKNGNEITQINKKTNENIKFINEYNNKNEITSKTKINNLTKKIIEKKIFSYNENNELSIIELYDQDGELVDELLFSYENKKLKSIYGQNISDEIHYINDLAIFETFTMGADRFIKFSNDKIIEDTSTEIIPENFKGNIRFAFKEEQVFYKHLYTYLVDTTIVDIIDPKNKFNHKCRIYDKFGNITDEHDSSQGIEKKYLLVYDKYNNYTKKEELGKFIKHNQNQILIERYFEYY